jgi:BASS family bile acid:Na+ symporter
MLGRIGRQGTRAVAASVALALALPMLGPYARPILTPCIVVLLFVAFLRVEPAALWGHVRRPAVLAAITLWCMVGVPVLVGTGLHLSGIAAARPDLTLALVMQSVAPPIMAAPAFAALMGLPVVLPLALLVAAIAVTPVTAPLLADLYAGEALSLSPAVLAGKLFAILAGSWIAAMIARHFLGRDRIEAHRAEIDGLNIVLLFVFAAALMDGVTWGILEKPLTIAALTALAFAMAGSVLALTALLFAPAGKRLSFALGFAAGHRNMGLMLAAAGTTLPETVWLYFAVAQFPIYLMPQILKPLARRYARQSGD